MREWVGIGSFQKKRNDACVGIRKDILYESEIRKRLKNREGGINSGFFYYR